MTLLALIVRYPTEEKERAPSRSRKRSRWRRSARLTLILVVTGIAVLFVVESGLRLGGVVPARVMPDSLLALTAERRVYRPARLPDGRELFVAPGRSLGPFNLPTFPSRREPGEIRVAIVGGTAAAGFPFDGRVAVGAWLGAGLRAVYGNRPVRVVNVARGWCSMRQAAHRVKEMLEHRPDAVVLWCGNSEYNPSHEYRVVGDGGRWARALRTLGAKSAIVEFLRVCLARTDEDWRWGFEVTDRVLQAPPGSEMEHEFLTDNFVYELNDAERAASESGIPLVVCTIPVNERDWAPFGRPSRNMDRGVRKEPLSAAIDELSEAVNAGRPAGVPEKARKLLGQHPRSSALYFVAGRAYEQLGEIDRARDSYAQSVELDPVTYRATASMNRSIRALCRNRPAVLADCEAILRASAVNGVLGYEQFFDHRHPVPVSHRLLSREVARALIESGTIPNPGGDWLQRFDAGLGKWASTVRFTAAERAEAHLRAALVLMKGITFRITASELGQAEGHLKECLRHNSHRPQARFYLGAVLFLTDRPEAAGAAWSEEIRDQKGNPLAAQALQALRQGKLLKKDFLNIGLYNYAPPPAVPSGPKSRQ